MKILNLKIAVRNALKNRIVSLAKLFGLSVSFAVIFFAAGYIYYETSFDKQIPDKEKIYRCYMKGQLNLEKVDYAVTAPAMAKTMVSDIPEITEAVRIRNQGNSSFNYEGVNYQAGELMQVDTNFFSFFSVPFVCSTEVPLVGKNDIAMATSVAEKYFGTAVNALGKNITLRGETGTITTIFNDFPKTSHIQLKLAQSIQKADPDQIGWNSQMLYTYFKTSTVLDNLDNINFKLTKLVYANTNDGVDSENAKTWDDLKFSTDYFIYYLAEPLTAIHFSNHKFDSSITSNKIYVYGTLIIALLILIISSLNYLNLNIASISMRVREVGIQKTIGAGKWDVFNQYIQETNLFWILSFSIALVLYLSFGKILSRYTGLNFELSNKENWGIFSTMFLVLLGLNIVINILPILFVATKKPVGLLKKEKLSGLNFSGNNGFVFIQFMLSLIIIIGAFFVQKQINYMLHKNRGYDSENVLNFSLWSIDEKNRASFIGELKKNPDVLAVTSSDQQFGTDPGMTGAWFNTQSGENYFHTSYMIVDNCFRDVYNLKLVEGRFFDKTRPSDLNALVINEAAAKEYRNGESLIGRKIILDYPREVIGVVKDFNYRSLHYKVEPLLLGNFEYYGWIDVKFRQEKSGDVIAAIKKLWTEFEIKVPLNYRFHDEQLALQYSNDIQAKKLMTVLSIISIIIACVGLYAVSVFSITRKTKEIGIHKVNGAKINELLLLINKRFLLWILLALAIAIPVSYISTYEWLQNFAFQTELSWWIFILSAIVAFGIAFLTVGLQSWKAASRNPVEALRYE